jgi:hypothetical protein
VNDAVADRRDIGKRLDDTDLGIDKLAENALDGLLVIGDIRGLLELFSTSRLISENRVLHANAFDEADGHTTFIGHVKQLVFKRGAAAIQYEDKHVYSLYSLFCVRVARHALTCHEFSPAVSAVRGRIPATPPSVRGVRHVFVSEPAHSTRSGASGPETMLNRYFHCTIDANRRF